MAKASWNQFQPLTQMSWKTYSILSAVPFIQACRWLEFHQSFRKALAKAPTFFENKSVDFQRQYIEFLIFLYPEKNRGKQASSPEKIILLHWAIQSEFLFQINCEKYPGLNLSLTTKLSTSLTSIVIALYPFIWSMKNMLKKKKVSLSPNDTIWQARFPNNKLIYYLINNLLHFEFLLSAFIV